MISRSHRLKPFQETTSCSLLHFCSCHHHWIMSLTLPELLEIALVDLLKSLPTDEL